MFFSEIVKVQKEIHKKYDEVFLEVLQKHNVIIHSNKLDSMLLIMLMKDYNLEVKKDEELKLKKVYIQGKLISVFTDITFDRLHDKMIGKFQYAIL